MRMITDERLGWDTRGFAAWLLTRPDGWEIRAGALPYLLGKGPARVGRERVRRFLRELERAGYLNRRRRRRADGTWVWESCFSPVAASFTMDGSAVDGSAVGGLAVDGQPVDLIHTLNNNRSAYSKLDKTTTTLPPSSGMEDGSESLPVCLRGRGRKAALALLSTCPPGDRGAVLREIEQRDACGQVRSPVGLLRRLTEAAAAGTFVPRSDSEQFAEKRAGAGVSPSKNREGGPRDAGAIAQSTVAQLSAATIARSVK